MMKLVLENIGMLKKAEVRLTPLVVIAGENDNGKSTVGKIVFSIIKALSRYEEDIKESKESRLFEHSVRMYSILQKEVRDFDRKELAGLEVLSFLKKPLLRHEALKQFEELIDRLQTSSILDNEAAKEVLEQLNTIKQIANEPEGGYHSIENALSKVFASEFDYSLLYLGAEKGSIKLLENERQLLEIQIDETNGVTMVSDVQPLRLRDATFIETPLVLNQYDLLSRSRTLLDFDRSEKALGAGLTTLHTKDLFEKLRSPSFDLVNSVEHKSLSDELLEIVNGEINFNRSKQEFVFSRQSKEISINNTASGVKTFGLLQLLARNGFLREDSIIIFDEPENHLHPNWQLKFAQLLVDIAEQGIYIMVSSHSPYIIEALKRFSDRAKLKDSACFYLAKDNEIEDKDKLAEMFSILSEPFEHFKNMDAEELKGETEQV